MPGSCLRNRMYGICTFTVLVPCQVGRVSKAVAAFQQLHCSISSSALHQERIGHPFSRPDRQQNLESDPVELRALHRTCWSSSIDTVHPPLQHDSPAQVQRRRLLRSPAFPSCFFDYILSQLAARRSRAGEAALCSRFHGTWERPQVLTHVAILRF